MTSTNWLDWSATPFLLAALVWISWVDIKTLRIPNSATIPLIVAGLALAAIRSGAIPVPNLIGAVAGYLVFAGLGMLFHRLRGVEGLGLGDAKLTAAVGAWLGWQVLPIFVLIASSSAMIAALFFAVPSANRIAFAPWLAFAFMLVWLNFLI